MQMNGSDQVIPAGVPEFKILLLGDGGVGKTTYVKRLTGKDLKEEELKQYQCTNGWKEYPLLVYTSHGPIKYTFRDIPGQEKVGKLKQKHYTGAHGAIIMVDVTCRMTLRSLPKLHKDVVDYCAEINRETIHCVLVANKTDITGDDRKVHDDDMEKVMENKMKMKLSYYNMSALRNTNLDKPLLWLTRTLLKDKRVNLNNDRPPFATLLPHTNAVDDDAMDIS